MITENHELKLSIMGRPATKASVLKQIMWSSSAIRREMEITLVAGEDMGNNSFHMILTYKEPSTKEEEHVIKRIHERVKLFSV